MTKKANLKFGGKRAAAQVEKAKQLATKKTGYLKLPEGVKKFDIKIGRYTFDILPYQVTDKNHPFHDDEEGIAQPGGYFWARPYYVHFNVGPNENVVVCPKTYGHRCPVCEYIKETELSKDDYGAIKQKEQWLYAVVPIDNKDYDETVHVMDISPYKFQEQFNEEINDDPKDRLNFPNLEGGYTLKVRFSSTTLGGGKPFPKATRIDFIERDEDYDESILDEVPNLDEVLDVKSYDEIFAILNGDEITDEDVDEPDEEPAKETKQRKTRTRKTSDKESEEDEPVRKKKTTGKVQTRGKKTTTSKKTETKDNDDGDNDDEHECPHGLRFGIDWNSSEVCDDCEVWDECGDKYKSK